MKLFAAILTTLLPLLPAVAEQASWQKEVLDAAWKRVAATHYDKNFEQKHQALLEQRRAEILASADHAEFARKFNALFREIGDSHIAILTPLSENGNTALQKLTPPPPSPGTDEEIPADPGFSLLKANGKLLVHERLPHLPQPAKIAPGDEITAIDGVRINFAEPVVPSWGLIARALLARGGSGSHVSVTFRRDGREFTEIMERRPNRGTPFQLGILPRMVATYRATLRKDNIAVVRINLFIPQIAAQLRHDVRNQLQNADGLIFDLRGNPGGILLAAEWLLAWSCPDKIPLGTMNISGARLTPSSEPQVRGFAKPLAVLVDDESCSTSELFAAALQDAGKAVIVGIQTPGQCLPSQVISLPHNFRLQTVWGEILRSNGERIERHGVKPDIEATVTAAGLASGRDEVLERAAAELKK